MVAVLQLLAQTHTHCIAVYCAVPMQALAHLEKHVLDKRTLCPAITRIHVKLLLASVVHDTLKFSLIPLT